MAEGILSKRVLDILKYYRFRRLNLRRCRSKTDFILFSKALSEAVDNNPHGPYVDKQPPEKLLREGAIPFLSEDGTAGVAVWPDGNIGAVFKKHTASKDPVMGELMLTALDAGGWKLDCFDGKLSVLYEMFGFIPVAKVSFDEDQAPDNWKKEFGTPDIIFWMHCGDTVEDVAQKLLNYPDCSSYTNYSEDFFKRLPCFEDYREAGQCRDKIMEERRLANPQ